MGYAPSRRQTLDSTAFEDDVHYSFNLYPNGKPCFLCGEILGDAADERTIYWSGVSADVFLHPACAVRLGQHLIKDGMIADSISTLAPLFRSAT